jgi:hypothetical protein
MKSLLYISARRDSASSFKDVEDIVTVSRPRNSLLELTGALVATPRHYAQILEGPAASVDAVMISIIRDPRHTDITLAPVEQKPGRDFNRWALAYHGESTYVSQLIATALAAPAFELARHAQDIRSLMAMFN